MSHGARLALCLLCTVAIGEDDDNSASAKREAYALFNRTCPSLGAMPHPWRLAFYYFHFMPSCRGLRRYRMLPYNIERNQRAKRGSLIL